MAIAATATGSATTTYTVHANGFEATGEFHASGNSGIIFNEYDLAAFNLSASDFGGQIDDITSLTLTLRHDPKSFTSGTSVDFYYSADDFAGGYSGLTFDASGANDPHGIIPGEFSSLVSLGSYPFTNKIYGETTSYTLDLSSIEASLINEINNGSDFQLIIAADSGSTITFQGVGPRFDGLVAIGPELTVEASVVPEPSSMLLVFGGIATMAISRRR